MGTPLVRSSIYVDSTIGSSTGLPEVRQQSYDRHRKVRGTADDLRSLQFLRLHHDSRHALIPS
jgi:hypothetical protein